MVVAVKIENKMKEENVLESSGQMWNKCVGKIRLDKKRKTCHFTLSSMEIYSVGCTLSVSGRNAYGAVLDHGP